MTLLYVLGTGSVWSDNELRYSLRSVAANMPGVRVVVSGTSPVWLVNATHLEVPDDPRNPVLSTMMKVVATIRTKAVDGPFLLMNDDFMLLRPTNTVQAYASGPLQRTIQQGHASPIHYAALVRTHDLLRRDGMALPLDMDTHHPLPMHVENVLDMLRQHPITARPYAWRSMYGNRYLADVEITPDVKMRSLFTPPGGTWFSYGDTVALSPDFRAWCAEMWPEPCRFERPM